jgi:hypothetical protein
MPKTLNNRFEENTPSFRASRFGALEGSIHFARKLRPKESIHIFLTPVTENSDDTNRPPVHTYFFPVNETLQSYIRPSQFVTLSTLIPGTYRIQILHDITRPFAKIGETFLKASRGDYISTNDPIVTIIPGETVKVDLKCQNRVRKY